MRFVFGIESPGVLGYDEVQLYTSSEDGDRVLRSTLSFDTAATSSNRIHIETEIRYQEILGFGSTFSDAAAITVSSLSSSAKKNAIDAYFSPKGAEYTLGRLPMGSTDFSVREYSYDDVDGDFDLEHFSLADEDTKYKEWKRDSWHAVSNIDINLFGTPWLTPSWMREVVNGEMMLKGPPNGRYYDTWAKYYTKFVEAYAAQNVDIWGLSVQNEPNAGYGRLAKLPNMTIAYTPQLQRDFIKLNLGPALKSANATKDTKLIVMDDQRDVASIFGDSEASRYADGIGVQWYSDSAFSTATLGTIHKNHPKKFILGTEAGFSFDKDKIGCWDRAEQYAYDIISDMNKFVTGWVDLNLFVDTAGGPNRAGLNSDAAIIVDSSKDLIYKQPMFYIMAHFSKFVRPGAHRVQMQMPGGVYGVAFVNA
ncbi:O-Glycosyl hydrolase family 30 [Ancylostoma caninum]|uniref:Glucosylceramidase n=1 Tax=Ancylostoma caninum TaxID=29170 RepID=A0A368H374_ANCCA|nr:O-Glycosyl hydrolase family 30 [Ancylostoma caninum]